MDRAPPSRLVAPTLDRFATKASRLDDPVEALSEAVSLLRALGGWQLGHAYLPVDSVGSSLRATGLWADDGGTGYAAFQEATAAAVMHPNLGMVGTVWATAQPKWVQGLSTNSEFVRRAGALESGLETAFAFPVLVDGSPVAVVELFARGDRTCSERVTRQTSMLAASLAGVFERAASKRALEAASHRFRTLFEGLPAPACLIDADRGVFVDVNHEFLRRLGFERTEVIDRSAAELGIWADRETLPAIRRNVQQGSYHTELDIHDVEGRQRTALATLSLVEWGGAKRILGVFFDITDRRRAERLLQRRQAQVRALLGRLLRLQEEERAHIAAELHDQVGQALTVLQLNLSSAAARAGDGRVVELMEESIATVDSIMDLVRTLSSELRPPTLEGMGLAASIRAFAARCAGRTGVEVVDLLQEPADATAAVRVACYRICQEALTNALRHANAQSLEIALTQEENTLVLRVKDDGVGFSDNGAPGRAPHLGLEIMRERAASVGGVVSIDSTPGAGTTVLARFPQAVTPS